jgi:hypothetical protein
MDTPIRDASQLSEREQMKLWVETWKSAGVELERIRKEEIRASKTTDFLTFSGMLATLLRELPPSCDTGLVEQQRLFQRLPHA